MTMRALSLALAAAAAAAVVATTDAESPIDRRLELTDICRYSPDTKVTDENALDLVRCLELSRRALLASSTDTHTPFLLLLTSHCIILMIL
jgi:hypothetical protein